MVICWKMVELSNDSECGVFSYLSLTQSGERERERERERDEKKLVTDNIDRMQS